MNFFFSSWFKNDHAFPEYDKKRAVKPMDANLWMAVRTFYYNKDEVISKVIKSANINEAFRDSHHSIVKYVQQYTTNDDSEFAPVDIKGEQKLANSPLVDITPKSVLDKIIKLGELYQNCQTSVQSSISNALRDRLKASGTKNKKAAMVMDMFDNKKAFDFEAFKSTLYTTDVYTIASQSPNPGLSLNIAQPGS